MQSLHGMIYGPSFGTLVAFGISLSFFVVYGYIIYFTTTVEIMETYGEENPYFEEAPEETKDYVFDLIGSDWNIWSIRMLFIHQFITLVYLIFYRKWQELEKRRKAKEEEEKIAEGELIGGNMGPQQRDNSARSCSKAA